MLSPTNKSKLERQETLLVFCGYCDIIRHRFRKTKQNSCSEKKWWWRKL